MQTTAQTAFSRQQRKKTALPILSLRISQNIKHTKPTVAYSNRPQSICNKVSNNIREQYSELLDKTNIDINNIKYVINDISRHDVIRILQEIHDDPEHLKKALRKSARSDVVYKVYLLEDKEQGWNLRLHTFPLGGVIDGDEEKPHFHRWGLVSKILSGGYINSHYDILPANEVVQENRYYQYRFDKSEKQSSDSFRTAKKIGYYGLRKNFEELYSKGNTYYFPVDLPHSTKDCSKHTGTTLTLSHTGKPVKECSSGFNQDSSLVSVKEKRFSCAEDLQKHLKKQINFLKLITLSEDMHSFLRGKNHKRDITEKEKLHLDDYKYPNYLETSLLPALAVLSYTQDNSHEFSKDTVKFIKKFLVSHDIQAQELEEIISNNQEDILLGRLSVAKNGL